MKKRALTGITPTGTIHIGNYLGAMREAIALQDKYECYYFIADLHALTTNKDPNKVRQQTYDIVAAWIACGFNYKDNVIYRQSDLPMTCELSWYLSCVTGIGMLNKAHAFKDAKAKGEEVNHGTYAYPVLMAADILLYDADIVPVGKDQVQHLEFTRDMAQSFNAIYGEVLKLPQKKINEKVMTVPGLDGRKMSKSYGNVIELFLPEKKLRKKIMSIKTDSTPLEEPKELDGTIVGDIYKLFASEDEYSLLKDKLHQGGMGWGHAKEELFKVMNRELTLPRERYYQLRDNEVLLEEILVNGAEKAFVVAKDVINRVRASLKFNTFPFKNIF